MFEYKTPKVISEIGCNHMGNFEIACELIKLSKDCGATVAKFQKRNNRELLTREQYDAPHPYPYNAYGNTYGLHREALEFSVEQHAALKKYCEETGIVYSTSVWDVTSALQIIDLNPEIIKVPSACNNHVALLKMLRDNYRGTVHVSLGMTAQEEEKSIIELFEATGQAKDRLVIYSCTSGYPVSFPDICLLEIRRLYDYYGHRVKEIGFSGHHLGIAVDIAAYTLGARWIERHFTKNRTWKGTDHAASLEVSGLQKLIRDLQHTHEALTFRASEILPCEYEQRDKLKYRKG